MPLNQIPLTPASPPQGGGSSQGTDNSNAMLLAAIRQLGDTLGSTGQMNEREMMKLQHKQALERDEAQRAHSDKQLYISSILMRGGAAADEVVAKMMAEADGKGGTATPDDINRLVEENRKKDFALLDEKRKHARKGAQEDADAAFAHFNDMELRKTQAEMEADRTVDAGLSNLRNMEARLNRFTREQHAKALSDLEQLALGGQAEIETYLQSADVAGALARKVGRAVLNGELNPEAPMFWEEAAAKFGVDLTQNTPISRAFHIVKDSTVFGGQANPQDAEAIARQAVNEGRFASADVFAAQGFIENLVHEINLGGGEQKAAPKTEGPKSDAQVLQDRYAPKSANVDAADAEARMNIRQAGLTRFSNDLKSIYTGLLDVSTEAVVRARSANVMLDVYEEAISRAESPDRIGSAVAAIADTTRVLGSVRNSIKAARLAGKPINENEILAPLNGSPLRDVFKGEFEPLANLTFADMDAAQIELLDKFVDQLDTIPIKDAEGNVTRVPAKEYIQQEYTKRMSALEAAMQEAGPITQATIESPRMRSLLLDSRNIAGSTRNLMEADVALGEEASLYERQQARQTALKEATKGAQPDTEDIKDRLGVEDEPTQAKGKQPTARGNEAAGAATPTPGPEQMNDSTPVGEPSTDVSSSADTFRRKLDEFQIRYAPRQERERLPAYSRLLAPLVPLANEPIDYDKADRAAAKAKTASINARNRRAMDNVLASANKVYGNGGGVASDGMAAAGRSVAKDGTPSTPPMANAMGGGSPQQAAQQQQRFAQQPAQGTMGQGGPLYGPQNPFA